MGFDFQVAQIWSCSWKYLLSSLRSLSLREGGTCQVLQGGCRQRAYARDYRRDTVVWKADKFSPAPTFSCFRGRSGQGGVKSGPQVSRRRKESAST